MSYKIIPTDRFKKEAKRLIKKFPSLKSELLQLNDLLHTSPTAGTALGSSMFKIRIAVKSKGKGKSGGARVITYHVTAQEEIYLLTIYDKSEYESIEDKTIKRMIDDIIDNQ